MFYYSTFLLVSLHSTFLCPAAANGNVDTVMYKYRDILKQFVDSFAPVGFKTTSVFGKDIKKVCIFLVNASLAVCAGKCSRQDTCHGYHFNESGGTCTFFEKVYFLNGIFFSSYHLTIHIRMYFLALIQLN